MQGDLQYKGICKSIFLREKNADLFQNYISDPPKVLYSSTERQIDKESS